MTSALDRVIVGNGAAAAEAALALRRAGYGGRVDLFADGARPPYNPMLGSYYVSGELEGRRCFPYGDAGFYARAGVHVHASTPVAHLDPAARSLTTAAGERFSYVKCLVATGATTAVPPVPGLAGPGVFVLRSFDDAVLLRGAVTAARVRAAAGAPPRALVMGASFAGVKIASVLQRLGLDVVIVERETSVLPCLAHRACAATVARHLSERGLDLRLGLVASSVDRCDGRLEVSFEDAARAGAGAASDPAGAGRRDVAETFDLAVVCTGSRANLGLLEASGLADNGGIDVDEAMTAPAPGLFAAGDVARTVDPLTGERATTALWASARRQGRVAGLTMAGVTAASAGRAACNIQHAGDLLFASGGSLAAADVVDVDEREGSLAVLGFRAGRLVGFNLVGDVRRAGPLACALGSERRGARDCNVAALAAAREMMTWTTRRAG